MTIDELAKRDQRSNDLQVYKLTDTEYFVESSKGKISYKVILNNVRKICTCADFSTNIQNNPEFVCKHILAVVNANGNINSMKALKHKPKLDNRWITNIKNKDFVVYSGLLDLAHQIGLQSIYVDVVQFPNKENGFEAICKSTTYTKDNQVFVDYGDANPKNTNSLVVNHILRVAATRAKARTLRDMTNIGMTCLEELGDEDVNDIQPTKTKRKTNAKSQQDTKQQSSTKTEQSESAKQEKKQPDKQTKQKDSNAQETKKGNDNRDGVDKPSSSQVNAIKNLAKRRGLSEQDMDNLAQEKLQIPFHEISAGQAGQFIKILQQSA